MTDDEIFIERRLVALKDAQASLDANDPASALRVWLAFETLYPFHSDGRRNYDLARPNPVRRLTADEVDFNAGRAATEEREAKERAAKAAADRIARIRALGLKVDPSGAVTGIA